MRPTDEQLDVLRERDRDMIPPILIKGMFAVMLGALSLVAFARLTDMPLQGVPAMDPIAQERPIGFLRSAEGSVLVTDGGEVIADLSGRSAGFIDSYARALERRRALRLIDQAAPVRLIEFEDGRLILVDPETDWRVDPRSFGPDSQEAFRRFLET
ncbi:putative photosynthetic complex assembly protein [Hasllibacter halocynthiae]|uniref:Putative photosynthetic complex assembly protein n=1 Tax=Hasllibacter halocynthiae TaxID=595589 RepID=A0A2T0X2S1_9RHOB|nr:photosynthetic complex assembly protein PuhC [Hasllibacter halocynthiae]PRY93246.1 putative photosynthetic complex assembly protein [Hasllibacter halocynthiae]